MKHVHYLIAACDEHIGQKKFNSTTCVHFRGAGAESGLYGLYTVHRCHCVPRSPEGKINYKVAFSSLSAVRSTTTPTGAETYEVLKQ